MMEKGFSPFEQFHSYMRGWYAGAGVKTVDPRYTGRDDELGNLYAQGFSNGVDARIAVRKAAWERFDYSPSVLRLHQNGEYTERTEDAKMKLDTSDENTRKVWESAMKARVETLTKELATAKAEINDLCELRQCSEQEAGTLYDDLATLKADKAKLEDKLKQTDKNLAEACEVIISLKKYRDYESDPAHYAKDHDGWVPMLPFRRMYAFLHKMGYVGEDA